MNTSSIETLHKYCVSLLNSVRGNRTARCILLQRTATSVGHRCAHAIARQTESSTASTPQRVIRKKWNTSWHFTNLQNLKPEPETCSSKGRGRICPPFGYSNKQSSKLTNGCVLFLYNSAAKVLLFFEIRKYFLKKMQKKFVFLQNVRFI